MYRAGLKRNASSEAAAKVYGALLAGQKRADANGFAAKWTKEHPKDAGFRTLLGDQALVQRDLAGAEIQYQLAAGIQPDNPIVLNNLAWVMNRLKKPEALAYAEKANALRADEPAFLDTLATVLADNGQASKALAIQKKAVARLPAYHPYRLNLAKLYIAVGDKALAKTELEQLAKLGPMFSNQATVGELLKSL